MTVTEWEPIEIHELKAQLRLLRFFATPGTSKDFEAAGSSRVDFYEQDSNPARKDYRAMLDRTLRECRTMADKIHVALRDRQAPVDPTQCTGCGSGFAKGSVFCSRCGSRL